MGWHSWWWELEVRLRLSGHIINKEGTQKNNIGLCRCKKFLGLSPKKAIDRIKQLSELREEHWMQCDLRFTNLTGGFRSPCDGGQMISWNPFYSFWSLIVYFYVITNFQHFYLIINNREGTLYVFIYRDFAKKTEKLNEMKPRRESQARLGQTRTRWSTLCCHQRSLAQGFISPI
jgi:hypothetical protein